jgi:hypothetical protein
MEQENQINQSAIGYVSREKNSLIPPPIGGNSLIMSGGGSRTGSAVRGLIMHKEEAKGTMANHHIQVSGFESIKHQ